MATKKKAAGKAKGQNEKAVKDLVDKTKARGEAKRTNEYQEEPDKKSKDKETVKVEVACPCCGETISVRVFKEITKKAVSAEYRLYGVAEKDPQAQLDLGLETPEEPGPKTTAEAEKTTPGGGRKKAS